MTAEAAPASQAARAGAGLQVTPVAGRADLEAFIRLPSRLYRGHPGFVAPLLMERREALDPAKNPFFRHARARFWLARRDGVPVGRISAQIDTLSLERHGAELGHFGMLDAEDDAATFRALTGAAEAWLAEQGMRRVRGPFSLSVNESCGLLVDGFDARPTMMMNYAPPYAGARVEACGYAKAKDLIAYDYELAATPEIDPRDLLRRRVNDGRVRVRPMDMRRYRAELALILEIFNDAWSENWSALPFTEEEMIHTASNLRPLIRPDLVWIAEVDGEVAGMIVCLPNLDEAIAGLDGRLLPLGWLTLLWRLKVKGLASSRVPLFGVRKRYHRSALGGALVMMLLKSLRESGKKAGIRHAELSWLLEDNVAIRQVVEAVGGRPYKTYRIYEKALG